MNGNGWLFLGTAITAIAGLAGVVYAARRPGRATPYDVVIARVVALEEQRKADRAEIEQLQDEVRALRGERAHALTEITGLQRRVAGMYDDRDDLVRYIGVLRAWVAAGARPPAPSVPSHLADVVPEWVPGDGAEVPRPKQPTEEVGP